MTRARMRTTLVCAAVTTAMATAVLAPVAAAPLAPGQKGVRVTAVRVGTYPGDLAVTSTRAYVASQDTRGEITVVNTRTSLVSRRVPVKPIPSAVTLSPDRSRLYVASASTGWISILDTATNTGAGQFRSGGAPVASAISPDGTRLYVAAWDDSEVVVHALPNGAVLARIPVPGLADSLAVHPDGSRLFAMVDDPRFGVAVIDVASNVVRTVIDLGQTGYPLGTALAVSPDGRRAYAMANPRPPQPGFVAVVDLSAGRLAGTIPVGADLRDAALGPGGTRLYVTVAGSGPGGPAGSNGLVAVIDAGSSHVIGTLSLDGAGRRGLSAQEVAVSPDGLRVHASLSGPRGWLATASLASIPATPTMPLSVRTTASGRTATVSWQPPASGGGVVTEYVAIATPIVEGPGLPGVACRTVTLSCRITGLDPTLGYTVRVQARNGAGWGPAAYGPDAGTSAAG
ncbi:MAG: fibronectin type III domain-containing protein [Actinomycetota bacterium]|nr:fibronectin type III domain-containing protein [Actinomycetota bacterium]